MGANAYITDSRGRTARRYVLNLNKEHEVYKVLLRTEQTKRKKINPAELEREESEM